MRHWGVNDVISLLVSLIGKIFLIWCYFLYLYKAICWGCHLSFFSKHKRCRLSPPDLQRSGPQWDPHNERAEHDAGLRSHGRCQEPSWRKRSLYHWAADQLKPMINWELPHGVVSSRPIWSIPLRQQGSFTFVDGCGSSQAVNDFHQKTISKIHHQSHQQQGIRGIFWDLN